MDGLTKIISKIESDASAQCDAILKKAQEQAQSILDEANMSAHQMSEQIIKKAQDEAMLIAEKATSACELAEKRVMLEVKGDIIKNVTINALDYLCSLPAEEYFENIMLLAVANALSGSGQMMFNKADYNRLPEGFEKTVNSKLESGKSVVVSKECISCKGGFVISYDEMRVDCTFESLIEDSFETIKDKLNEVLFS